MFFVFFFFFLCLLELSKYSFLPWILCRYIAGDSPYLAITKQARQTKALRTAAWKLSDFYMHM